MTVTMHHLFVFSKNILIKLLKSTTISYFIMANQPNCMRHQCEQRNGAKSSQTMTTEADMDSSQYSSA